VAILVANNLRDIPTDAATGKRTLAVRLGDRGTRIVYRACVAASFAVVVIGVAVGEDDGLPAWSLLALGAIVAAIPPLRAVGHASGRELVPVLVATGALQVAFGALLALGLWIAGRVA
jgi:1,4-dihydroxy-2-naphthoate octaprenyltransferase